MKHVTNSRAKSQPSKVRKPANRQTKIVSLPLLSANDLREIERLFHPVVEPPAARKRWVQLAFDLPRVGMFREQHPWSFSSVAGVTLGKCARCELVVTVPVPAFIRECRRVGEVRS